MCDYYRILPKLAISADHKISQLTIKTPQKHKLLDGHQLNFGSRTISVSQWLTPWRVSMENGKMTKKAV